MLFSYLFPFDFYEVGSLTEYGRSPSSLGNHTGLDSAHVLELRCLCPVFIPALLSQ